MKINLEICRGRLYASVEKFDGSRTFERRESRIFGTSGIHCVLEGGGIEILRISGNFLKCNRLY